MNSGFWKILPLAAFHAAHDLLFQRRWSDLCNLEFEKAASIRDEIAEMKLVFMMGSV